MSIRSQQQNMREISILVKQDLGYIYGDPEGRRPAGAKKMFLSKSQTLLRGLVKDLDFLEHKINTNPGGIAVSGEVSLYGMWSKDKGIHIKIFQPIGQLTGCIMYRSISHIKDFTGGLNHYIRNDIFERADYNALLTTIRSMKGVADNGRQAA